MITVILAEPEHPGNIGSVARVMRNFGFSKLVLINPKCRIDKQARDLAKHSHSILDNAAVSDWSVLDQFSVVAATAGKPVTDNNFLRTALTPAQAAKKLSSVKNAAVLFGRESTGLTNSELEKADFVVTIPTSPENPSMNLSHAAAVVLYELYMRQPAKQFNPITATERRVLEQKVAALVKELPFNTDGKRRAQEKVWKSIFGRALLTKREAYATLGLFSAIERQRKLQRAGARRRTR